MGMGVQILIRRSNSLSFIGGKRVIPFLIFTISSLGRIVMFSLLHFSSLKKNEYSFTPGYDPSAYPFSWGEVKNRLVPAVRDNGTGELFIGRRGEAHHEIRRKFLTDYASYKKYWDGFYDPRKKQYYAGKDIDLDSTDLMTPRQVDDYHDRRLFDEKSSFDWKYGG